MDENNNNNNDSKALNALKKLGKRAAKELAKLAIKAVKHIIKFLFTPPVLPYTIIVIVCILALALILGIINYVLSFFSGSLGLDADSLATSTNATVIQSQKMITIDSDTGQYIVNDEYSEKILEGLQLQQVDTEKVELVDIDNDMLNKYIEAEVKTMFPKTQNNEFNAGEFDGLVKIHRDDAESGSSIPLDYIKYSDFYAYINNEDDRVLNYFTLNPDDFKLHIAYSEKTEDKDYNGAVINSETIIKVDIIDYQSEIFNYATPLNYYISMHMICQDKDFMNELVDMVDETEIVFSFVQSTYRDVKKVDYYGEITPINYNVTGEDVDIPNPDHREGDISSGPPYLRVKRYNKTETPGELITVGNENISEYSNYITPAQYHMIEKTYNSGTTRVTTANTWRLKSQLKIEHNLPHTDYISDSELTNKVEIDESESVPTNEEASGTYNTGWIGEYTSEWTDSYTLVTNEDEQGYDLTDFMDLIETYPKVKSNLETAPSMLFYLLEKNENTQELANVMKYVIFKFTGDDYGVTKLDEIFDFSDFSSFDAIYGNTIEEKIWFALIEANIPENAAAGVLANLYAESGIRANNLQDDKEVPLGHTDVSYTEAVNSGAYTSFISDGAGYGIAQWTFSSRKEGLYNYSKSIGVGIDNEDMQITYLIGEILHGGGANGYASCQIRNYNGFTENDWRRASSPEEAAESFCWIFEKPSSGSANIEKRKSAARGYWEKYNGKTRPEGGEIQAAAGDGYSQVYTSSTGRTYKEYKQWMGAHAKMTFSYYGETIASSGCSITSVATVTSGYNNNQTPASLASRTPVLAELLTEGGAKCSGYLPANAQKLTSGKPSVVSIRGTLVTERGSKYYKGHYIAILDARNGNEVYVSDVGANDVKVRWLDECSKHYKYC